MLKFSSNQHGGDFLTMEQAGNYKFADGGKTGNYNILHCFCRHVHAFVLLLPASTVRTAVSPVPSNYRYTAMKLFIWYSAEVFFLIYICFGGQYIFYRIHRSLFLFYFLCCGRHYTPGVKGVCLFFIIIYFLFVVAGNTINNCTALRSIFF